MPNGRTISPTCALTFLAILILTYANESRGSNSLSEEAAVFAKPSFVRQILISPDGRTLMVAAELEEDQTITFLSADSMEALRSVEFDGRWRLGPAEWITDNSLVVSPSYRPNLRNYTVPTGNLTLVHANKKRPKALFGPLAEINRSTALAGRRNERFGAVLLDPLSNKEDWILVQLFDAHRTGFAELHVNSGRLEGRTFAPSKYCRFSVDEGGQVRFCSMRDPMTELDSIYEFGDSGWKNIHLSEDRIRARVLSGPNESGYPLVIADAGTARTRSLYSLESFLKGGAPLFSDPVFDIWGVSGFPTSGPYAVATGSPVPNYLYPEQLNSAAKTLARIHRSLATSFPGQFIDITSHDAAFEKFIVSISNDTSPGKFYLYDQETGKLKHLADKRPWLNNRSLAEKHPIKFRTQDDLTLHGFLTRAIADRPRQAPSIILVHGGPHGPLDTFHFDHEVQFLAALGLNVIQVNFRGSGGFGQAFIEKGYGEWSRKMVDDVIAGFKSLAGTEVGTEACIYGASYGAFNALSAAFRAPDTFVCAAGHVGVYSLPELFKQGDISEDDIGLAYLKRVLGEDREALRADSPVFNAGHIEVPVFLSAGRDDVRAPERQTKLMAAAIKDANKQVQELYIDREGHGFASAKNETERLTQMGAFFLSHLSP